MHEKMNQPPTRPNTSTAVILATLADCAPPFPGLVTPTVAFRDTPAGSPLTRHRVHSVRLVITSGPREPLDALENLPQEAPCQVAFGKLQDEVPGRSNEASARFEQPLLETRQGPALDETGRTSWRSRLPRL